ncbi:hypothetical protein [Phycicoccus avicenniae]|uniref:hypothetical protein n=1 Tax=Phycicoccus avicenniae TaxID=2828860 RepID=UPI003D2BBB40
MDVASVLLGSKSLGQQRDDHLWADSFVGLRLNVDDLRVIAQIMEPLSAEAVRAASKSYGVSDGGWHPQDETNLEAVLVRHPVELQRMRLNTSWVNPGGTLGESSIQVSAAEIRLVTVFDPQTRAEATTAHRAICRVVESAPRLPPHQVVAWRLFRRFRIALLAVIVGTVFLVTRDWVLTGLASAIAWLLAKQGPGNFEPRYERLIARDWLSLQSHAELHRLRADRRANRRVAVWTTLLAGPLSAALGAFLQWWLTGG